MKKTIAAVLAAVSISLAAGCAEAARCILYGEKGAGRDAVLLNAGAALHILKGITIEDGIQLAADTIDSGAAMKTLEKYIKVSNEVKA